MKTNKMLTALMILFIGLQISFSQENSEAILADELQALYCDDYWARIDAFMAELHKNQLYGQIIIYGKENELIQNLTYEQWTNGIIKFRGFDKNRIEVVRGALGKNIKIQFWKVPKGQEPPSVKKDNWSYKLPDLAKPFVFFNYEDIICLSSPSPIKDYADILLANPKARGHLVIRDKTNKKFRKTEIEVLDELVNKYKIPRRRLKVFNVINKKPLLSSPDVEFWIVP
ncbi:MAG TPA: hypothetical protein VK308_14235 [Pyrinomonadaceae bacterium]|nr:hypothetical protein [Pyrinomonadaceae bacterium]